jgi:drug/metabolite transporter (DMT)-like permease
MNHHVDLQGVERGFSLLLAAMIWSFACVAQRTGMEHVGPLHLQRRPFHPGGAGVAAVAVWLGRRSVIPVRVSGWRPVLVGGLLAGLLLFAGASLQQVGLVHTTAGKAGFITGSYVVIVPLLGLLWGQVRAGLTTGLTTAFYTIAYAALIFSGDLNHWLPQGIGVTLR